MVALVWLQLRGGWGRLSQAVADNPQRAASLGIRPARVTARAWLFAGLAAGIAGVVPQLETGSAVASSVEGATTIRLETIVVVVVALFLAGFGRPSRAPSSRRGWC